MTLEEVQGKIEELSKDTKVVIKDFSKAHRKNHGHYMAKVISSSFQGKNTLERHRMVYDLLDEQIKSGAIHALTLDTKTPEEFEKSSKK